MRTATISNGKFAQRLLLLAAVGNHVGSATIAKSSQPVKWTEDRLFLGVPNELHAHFEAALSNWKFECVDKSAAVPLEYVNDDFCDCEDGTDELGTAACTLVVKQAKFWCKNVKYRGNFIHASKVNDGVCDCCDGSDEWNKVHTECQNKCDEQVLWQRAQEAAGRKEQAKRVKIRKQWTKQGRQAYRQSRRMISRLETEIESLTKEIIDLNSKVEKNTTKQTTAPPPLDETSSNSTSECDTAGGQEDTDKLQDDSQEETETTEEEQFDPSDDNDDNGDGDTLISEYAQWIDKENDKVDDDAVDLHADWNTYDDNEVDYSDDASLLERLEETLRSYYWSFKRLSVGLYRQMKLNLQASRLAYKEATKDAERSLREKKESLKQLRREHKTFGKHYHLYHLKDECLRKRSGSWDYEICLFRDSWQKSNGHRTTVGKFDSISDDGKVIHFESGARCINGLQRSLDVSLICGSTTEAVEVTETKLCTYRATVKTPAACTDDDVQELSGKDEL